MLKRVAVTLAVGARMAAILAVLVLAVGTVTACQPKNDDATGVPFPGSSVQAGPRAYVPQCVDVTDMEGPCVGQEGASGTWRYVPAGSHWPHGTPVALCPDNGWTDVPATPCAWLPSVQGHHSGDSGAYVYGVPCAGCPAGPEAFAGPEVKR